MGAGPLATALVGTCLVAVSLVFRYGDWRRHHPLVTGSVLIAWSFSLIIVFVLPMDVSTTSYDKCVRDAHNLSTTIPPTWPLPTTTVAPALAEAATTLSVVDSTSVSAAAALIDAGVSSSPATPAAPPCVRPWSYAGSQVLTALWRLVYWSSQALTWLIMPLMQSYSQAGEFTWRGRLRTAVVDNLLYYASYLVIAIVLLIYISFKGVSFDWPHLKLIASSASNTWGLLLLVLLLGYSLVELPRALWQAGQQAASLRRAQFRAAKLSAERSEAEEALDDALDSLQLAAAAVGAAHPLRRCVDTVLSRVPAALQERMRRRQRAGEAGPAPTEKSLVALHRRVIQAVQHQHRTEVQWEVLMTEAIELEDVVENLMHRDGIFKPSVVRQPTWTSALVGPRLEWYWKCRLRGYLLRCLALVCAVTSLMVVWSELTFFVKTPTLSLFAIFINAAHHNRDYVALEVVSCLIIAYLCVCTYYTIFQIRVLNFYYLAPNHQTDQHSLIFSGMLLCRLTPPLCLNFLGMIHMDSHVIRERADETAYTQIMGHMDVLSVLSDGFYIYFPCCVLAFCLATYLSLGARLLSFLGFQQFIAQDDITADLVYEGRELVKREQRQRQRLHGSSSGSATAPDGPERRRWGSDAYRAAKERAQTTHLRGWRARADSADSARLQLLGSPEAPPPPPAADDDDGGWPAAAPTLADDDGHWLSTAPAQVGGLTVGLPPAPAPRRIFDDV